MAGTPNQIENLKRARAAKAAIAKLEGSKTTVSPCFMMDDQVWLQGMIAAVGSLEIKSPVYVKDAVVIADAILAAYKAKFQ